jgi:hypothetical protein
MPQPNNKPKRCIVYMPTGLYYKLAAQLKAAARPQSVSSFFRAQAIKKVSS